MSVQSMLLPYASWLLDTGKHLWPMGEIGFELYQSRDIFKAWTTNPAAVTIDLTLKTLLMFSNCASTALSFKTCQQKQAMTARISSFVDAWNHGQEYLKGAAKKFLMSPFADHRLERLQALEGLSEKEAEQVVLTGILFIKDYLPLYQNFCRFVAIEDQKFASRIISKLQLFSLLISFVQYLIKKPSNVSSSEFFIYHVLKYGSTALDCAITANKTNLKTSSLAFETFHKVIGAFPWMIRSIIACKVLYPIYIAGIEFRKARPIIVKGFCLMRYQLPSSLQDFSLQYIQLPAVYHQHASFNTNICPLGHKPITQALFIVESKEIFYMFEKVALAQYVFQTRGTLTNPCSGKVFTVHQIYIDSSFNEKLTQLFLQMMNANFQQG